MEGHAGCGFPENRREKNEKKNKEDKRITH